MSNLKVLNVESSTATAHDIDLNYYVKQVFATIDNFYARIYYYCQPWFQWGPCNSQP